MIYTKNALKRGDKNKNKNYVGRNKMGQVITSSNYDFDKLLTTTDL